MHASGNLAPAVKLLHDLSINVAEQIKLIQKLIRGWVECLHTSGNHAPAIRTLQDSAINLA